MKNISGPTEPPPSVSWRGVPIEHQLALEGVIAPLLWVGDWQRTQLERNGAYSARLDSLVGHLPEGMTLWVDAAEDYAVVVGVHVGAPGSACGFWLGSHAGDLLWGLERPPRGRDIVCGALPPPPERRTLPDLRPRNPGSSSSRPPRRRALTSG